MPWGSLKLVWPQAHSGHWAEWKLGSFHRLRVGVTETAEPLKSHMLVPCHTPLYIHILSQVCATESEHVERVIHLGGRERDFS